MADATDVEKAVAVIDALGFKDLSRSFGTTAILKRLRKAKRGLKNGFARAQSL